MESVVDGDKKLVSVGNNDNVDNSNKSGNKVDTMSFLNRTGGK